MVVARALPDKPGQVVIEKIEGDNGRLTLDPTKNCIGIAAQETLRLVGNVSCGVSLSLQKVCALCVRAGPCLSLLLLQMVCIL